ncbi:MAG: pentapeptide repeat-containing protein [Blastocatellia bacterium]|nr:pentapeptide repeat-containing protein [Blastocatellia bacterium]
MAGQSDRNEVWLSCAPEDRVWAERLLAPRLVEEGAALRWCSESASPEQHWQEWREAAESGSAKLVAIANPLHLRNERLLLEIETFRKEYEKRLLTERPLVPILRFDRRLSGPFNTLRPIDFSRGEDFELRFRQLVEALELPGEPWREAGSLRPRVSGAINSLFDWMGIGGRASRFEDGIAEYYRLLGFEVARRARIGETVVEVFIEKRIGGMTYRTVIECRETAPTAAQIEEIVQRQKQIRQQNPKIDCLVVTAQPLDEGARSRLDRNGIDFITYPELLRAFIPLDSYNDKLIAELDLWRANNWSGEDWFIRPLAETDANQQIRPALEHVSRWLRKKGGGLLPLLGDVGTGKTTLASFLAGKLAEAWKDDPLRHPAPILIRLKYVRKETSLESIIITHFKDFLSPKEMNEFSYPRFEHLVRQGRVVLLFDAFDEMAERLRRDVMRNNLDELIRPSQQGGRVMLTCRKAYFKDRKEQEGYIGEGAVYLPEFTDEQVRAYLRKARPANHEQDWEAIQKIYNLRELVKRPLLLDMVVKGMPKLRDVNASTLYAEYVRAWFEREQTKGRILDKAVKFTLMKELAWKIWDEEKHKIHFTDLLHLVEGLKGVKLDFRGEESTDVAEELSTASFLKRNETGHYEFADRSFGEYFLALQIYDRISARDPRELRDALRTRRFDDRMVFFLNLLKKRAAEFQPLGEILAKEFEPQVSENALQILYWIGRCRCEMEGKITDPEALRLALADLIPEGARLSNARLAGIDLEGVTLRSAELHSVDLTGATLDQADLTGANLRAAILSKAKMNRMQAVGADFRESRLSEAEIIESDLRDCDFTGTIHRATIFERNRTDRAKGLNVEKRLLRMDLFPVVQQQFSSRFHSMAFGASGEWYAAGNQDGLITIHRVRDDRLLFLLPGHRKLVYSLQFSPSEALLVSGGLDGVVRLWSVSDGRLLQEIEVHTDRVRAVRFSPDGRLLASAGEDKVIRLWLVEERRALRSLGGFEGHARSVNAIDFSPDGKRLASAGSDGTVRVWEVATGAQLKVIQIEENGGDPRPFEINAVRFSPDGARIASTDDAHCVRIHDAGEDGGHELFRGHTDEVRALSFSPDGQFLISGGRDRTPRVWSIPKRALHRQLEPHSDYVDAVHFTADGARLMIGSTDRSIRVREFENGSLKETEAGKSDQPARFGGAVNAIALSPDGARLASGGADPYVYLWAANDSRLDRALEGPGAPVTSLDFSSDGQWLASGADDGLVRLWSAIDGRVRHDLRGHEARVTAVHFWPKRDLLVTGSLDRTVRLWLIGSGELSNLNRRHGAAINDVQFSPDGSLLAVACEDQSVWLWTSRDAQPPQLARKFEGHFDGVLVTRFSPNGVYLASGGKDNAVRIWLLADGKQRFHFEGHTDRISSLAFSPGGKLLASGSLDGVVCIWDLETGKLSQRLTGSLGEVRSIVFSRNSRCLIAGGSGGRLQFWDLENGLPRLFRYGLDHDIWLDVMPNGIFHASEKGRRYLCYTEQGTLHSYPAETQLTDYQDLGAIQMVLKELVAPGAADTL